MTLSELSEATGVSVSALCEIERRRRRPRAKTARRILDALGFSWEPYYIEIFFQKIRGRRFA